MAQATSEDGIRTGETSLRRFGRACAAVLARERDRWPLWLPVGMGTGVALYFAWPDEPPLWPVLCLLAVTVLAAVFGLRRLRRLGTGQGAALVALAFAAVVLGFAAAAWRAQDVAAPVVQDRMGPVSVTGRIHAIEPGLEGARITLDELSIRFLKASETPERIRLRLRPGADRGLATGDRVRAFAFVMPPPEPAAPGAFDFARSAWFQRLGGVGFAVSGPERLRAAPPDDAGWWTALSQWTGELRRSMHARITAAIPGAPGGVAAALMTGERGAIPPAEMEAMRTAGLAHLLAISGLHVGLVTGVLFFGIRAVLALWPALALRHPIKKWAAFAALLGAFAYMMITGATVPTQRAFLMAGLVLLAVMVDRSAISMRLVAWAAAVVLLIAPESLTGPSFQMSFAAVIALVAVYEGSKNRFARWRADAGWMRRAGLYLMGVMLTTLVAGLATAPFALFHFNRFAVFGLAGNLGAVPLTALWIMPWATIAYLLMPLELEQIALAPMGWGIWLMLSIAREVSSWPGAAAHVAAMPVVALVAVAVGGLWVSLWRTRLRWLGAAGVAAGLLTGAFARPPDLLVTADAQSFAVRAPDGGMVFGGAPLRDYLRDVWLRRAGLEGRAPDSGPAGPTSAISLAEAKGPLTCDSLACIYRVRAATVSIVRDPVAALEDCHRADLVVALTPLRGIRCRAPVAVIGRFDIWRHGAYAAWIDGPGRVRIESANAHRGNRPWVRRPGGD